MKLTWDALTDRRYEAGVDRGVFYPATGPGVAWNGLLTVNEDVDDFNESLMYVDGQKFFTQLELGTFKASLGAITYPKEFEPYDGYSSSLTGQRRQLFGFSYRTKLGDAIQDLSLGYKLHIVYNALATPTQRQNTSLDQQAIIDAFQWDISTLPISIDGFRPTAHLIFDSTSVNPASLAAIEDELYGTSGTTPRLPAISDIISIFEPNAIFTVTPHGDGTVTITGPDDWVFLVATDQWEISSPSVIPLMIDSKIDARSY